MASLSFSPTKQNCFECKQYALVEDWSSGFIVCRACGVVNETNIIDHRPEMGYTEDFEMLQRVNHYGHSYHHYDNHVKWSSDISLGMPSKRIRGARNYHLLPLLE
jgi:transcription initiation factor TFIIIB Brf1 subunit/transcription initiation factor TFIIB